MSTELGNNLDKLDGCSEQLLDVLQSEKTAPITWREAVQENFKLMKLLYASGDGQISNTKSKLFLSRVKKLEMCMRVDLLIRIARQDQRKPLYLDRTISVFNRAVKMFSQPANSNDCLHSQAGDLSAQLLAVILDHGFCGSVATMAIDEASSRINQMRSNLATASKTLDSIESVFILQNVIAEMWGLKYAIIDDNCHELGDKMKPLELEIKNTEASVISQHLKSENLTNYIEMARFNNTLSTANVDTGHSDAIMTDHTSHSATCEWLFERLDSWIEKSDSQIFLLSGRAGSGKSAFAASVCKRYPKEILASYAFDKSADNNHNKVTTMISALAKELTESLPEYASAIEKLKSTPLNVILKKGWRNMYEAFLEDPLTDIYGSQPRTPRSPQRHPETYSHKIILIDAIDECAQTEWDQLKQFLSNFSSNIHPRVGLLLTVRNKYQSMLVPVPNENVTCISLESRSLSGRHLKDVELYIAGCLGVLLSDEDDAGYLHHARTDAMTLQDTVDELLKASAGRFDYAIDVVMAFAKSMGSSGQFLGSIKKTLTLMQQKYGQDFERRKAEFAPLFRSYRDKEGRLVVVKVLRHGRHLLERSRAVLVTHKGRHVD